MAQITMSANKPTKAERIFTVPYCLLFVCAIVANAGYTMTNSTMATYLKDFSASQAMLSILPGLMSFVALLARPFVGRISDIFNRKWVQIAGFLCVSISMLGYAFATSDWMLTIARVMHGVGFSLSSTAGLALAADILPEKKMAQGLSYYGACATISQAFAPGLALKIIAAAGFRVMYLTAAAVTAMAVLGALFFRYQYDQDAVAQRRAKKTKVSDLFALEAAVPAVIAMMNSFASGAITGFIVLHATQCGVSNPSLYHTANAAMMLACRFILGKQMSKIKPVLVVVPCGCLILCTLIVISRLSSNIGLIVAGLLFGLGYGGLQPVLQTLCIQAVGPEKRGAASGIYYLGLDTGNAFGPMLVGFLGGALFGGMYGPCYLLMCIPIVAGIVIMLVWNKRARRKTC